FLQRLPNLELAEHDFDLHFPKTRTTQKSFILRLQEQRPSILRKSARIAVGPNQRLSIKKQPHPNLLPARTNRAAVRRSQDSSRSTPRAIQTQTACGQSRFSPPELAP